jgi:hypothetical protein
MRRGFAWLALLLLPTLALAQAETGGKVTGKVVDEQGTAVSGAEIVFTSPALLGERKTTTDAEGRYLAALLPPGAYMITVTAPGKSPVQVSFRVGVAETVPIDVTLKTGEMRKEEITVFAPPVKMQTTTSGENINYQTELSELPVPAAGGQRNIDRVAQLAPNTSFGPTANTIAISGAPSFDNSVLLDGSDISDPFYSSGVVVYVEEAIDQVQVMTNGVSARYGRFQGGVISATTKSGGNTFDGTVRADLSQQSWNSQTPFGEPQSDDLSKIYSATVGGPILRDHLWFFLGGRTIPTSSIAHSFIKPPFDATSGFQTETDEDRWQVKLTGAFNANHTVEASYLKYDATVTDYDPFQWVAEPNALIPERSDPRKHGTFEYQGVLTEHLFLNAQVAKKDASIVRGGDPALPSPILESFEGHYYGYANGWWDPNDPSERNSESAALSLTHSLSTTSWGNHTLEYGIQYVDSITAGDNRQSPTGYNLYYNTPVATAASFADCSSGTCLFDLDETQWFNERLKAIPGVGEQDMKNYAVYAQDSWEINKWRLDLGLRWENWKGEAISPAMTLDFDALSPRLGVTYNITPEWQLQGTWGKYISRFNDGVANGVSGISSIYGPGVLQEYSGAVQNDLTAAEVDAVLHDDSQWGTILGFVDPLQPTTFFSDDIGASYAEDLNFSVKRALPRNQGVVTFTYTNRKFKDLMENYVGGQGNITVTLPDTSTTDVNRVIWDNCTTCRRDYEALATTWDYRPSATWNLGGNYTYSTLEGNYEGELTGQPAIGSIIGNYPNNIQSQLAYPYGYLLADVRHKVRAWGAYRFDFARAGKLTFGGIFQYRSGSAYSNTARVTILTPDPAPDYNGSPSSYIAFFGGRGAQRFNPFWALDTSIRYDIGIWKDLNAYVKFDIQNITDNDELVTFKTGGTAQPGPGGVLDFVPNVDPETGLVTYGDPVDELSYQTPRSFFVTLGLNF